MIDGEQARTFSRCMAVGGVAVFGADTVYGLACAPDDDDAVQRLYAMKRRRPDKSAAIMFFDADVADEALPELGPHTRAALRALVPGPVTVLLANPERRFPLACTGDPLTLGLRVPGLLPGTTALQAVRWPVLQSSANLAGGPEARLLRDVPQAMRLEADLVLDAGLLPGVASTVVDLRTFEKGGTWAIRRRGAMTEARIAARLGF